MTTDRQHSLIARTRSSRIVRVSATLMLLVIVFGGVAIVYSALTSGVAL